jgi:hypothetical protein
LDQTSCLHNASKLELGAIFLGDNIMWGYESWEGYLKWVTRLGIGADEDYEITKHNW